MCSLHFTRYTHTHTHTHLNISSPPHYACVRKWLAWFTDIINKKTIKNQSKRNHDHQSQVYYYQSVLKIPIRIFLETMKNIYNSVPGPMENTGFLLSIIIVGSGCSRRPRETHLFTALPKHAQWGCMRGLPARLYSSSWSRTVSLSVNDLSSCLEHVWILIGWGGVELEGGESAWI